MKKTTALAISVIGMFTLIPGYCLAVGLGYAFTEGYEYSNNIYRVGNKGDDEQINSFSGDLFLEQNSPSLELDIQAGGIYRDYYWESYQDDYDLRSRSLIDWKIVPDKFSWYLSNNYQQILISTLVNDRPDNQQDRNVLSTGPDVAFRFAGDYRLSLSLRYEDYYYEESELDNQRERLSVRLEHALNSVSTILLHGDHSVVDYDNELVNRNFLEDRVYLGYQRKLSRFRGEVNLGYSRTRPDDIKTVTGAYLSMLMGYRHNSRTESELSYMRYYSDVADFARSSTASEFDNETDNGIFLFTELLARLRYGDGIDNLTFGLLYRERDYQGGGLDRKRGGAVLDYKRSVHPLLQFFLTGAYGSEDYLQIQRKDEISDASLGFNYMLNRKMSLSISASSSRLDSTDKAAEYTEQKGLLSITYRKPARLATAP